MSRWQTEFEQHPFQTNWKSLIQEAAGLAVDDQTILTDVQELARFKRVIEYLREAILNVDVELVPKSVWDSFSGQCMPCLQEVANYRSNRNIAHLQSANLHLDNLLTYVKPYFILPESVIEVIGASATAYRAQLEQYVSSFQDRVLVASKDIGAQSVESKNLIAAMQKIKDQVDALVIDLIDGRDEKVSIKTAIETTKSIIDKQAEEITTTYKTMLIDAPEAESTKTKVEGAKKNILSTDQQIKDLLKETKDTVNDLADFYVNIFGEKDAEGKTNGGLKLELLNRTKQIDSLEREQTSKYQALFEKIESLLPGATSAGLARAYEVRRRSFAIPIKNNTYLFYAAVALMPVVAFVTSIESFSLWPFIITFIDHKTVEDILKAMLMKLPFIGPLIWLAVFASIRRSQYERLQQEYAHKEALAKSYESYKKQLEALLLTDAEPLQKELIEKAISAIAYNASQTLDGKHRDKMPLEYALDVLGSEKGQSFLKRLSKFFPLKKDV